MNLATLIEDHPADRPALISGGDVTTYGELRDQVAEVRGALVARDIGPGDRVAILAGNTPHFVTAYLAVLGAGAIAVPLNPESPAAELHRELAVVEASLALIEPGGHAPAEVLHLAHANGFPRAPTTSSSSC